MHLTKREIAQLEIRNAIETNRYRPGAVISQRQISEDLGLSVTPIREAVIELCSNGIVERHSHHSIKVKEIDRDRLKNFFYVRHLLEEKAIELCIRNVDAEFVEKLRRINAKLENLIDSPEQNLINSLDQEFHKTIIAACNNEALEWTINQVKSSFPVYALWLEPGRLAVSVKEHASLIDVLEAGDLVGSIQAQHDHLARGLEATLAYLARDMSNLRDNESN